MNGSAAYGISPQVLASVVRITTHHRLYDKPNSRDDVFYFRRTLLQQHNATVTEPGDAKALIGVRLYFFSQFFARLHGRVVPLTNIDMSDAQKRTTRATSSATPMRPSAPAAMPGYRQIAAATCHGNWLYLPALNWIYSTTRGRVQTPTSARISAPSCGIDQHLQGVGNIWNDTALD